jgi:hypothetical protein
MASRTHGPSVVHHQFHRSIGVPILPFFVSNKLTGRFSAQMQCGFNSHWTKNMTDVLSSPESQTTVELTKEKPA